MQKIGLNKFISIIIIDIGIILFFLPFSNIFIFNKNIYIQYDFGYYHTWTHYFLGYNDERYISTTSASEGKTLFKNKVYLGMASNGHERVYKIIGKKVQDYLLLEYREFNYIYGSRLYKNVKLAKVYDYKYGAIGEITQITDNGDTITFIVEGKYKDAIFNKAIFNIKKGAEVVEVGVPCPSELILNTDSLKVDTKVKVIVNSDSDNNYSNEEIRRVYIFHGENLYCNQEEINKYLKE